MSICNNEQLLKNQLKLVQKKKEYALDDIEMLSDHWMADPKFGTSEFKKRIYQQKLEDIKTYNDQILELQKNLDSIKKD
jgi:mannitol-specific phosphotransferase system IIBC component